MTGDSDIEIRDLELGSEAAAVPETRRFLGDLLTSLGSDHAAEAELCASELVTNAVLHGQPPVRLSILGDRRRLRVEVSDADPAPAFGGGNGGPRSATGRGLLIVSAVADRCGEQVDADGKTVWFELGPPGLVGAPDPPPGAGSAPGGGRVSVVLTDVPVALALELDVHLDDLARDLHLAGSSPQVPPDLRRRLPGLLQRHRLRRATMDDALRAAHDDGSPHAEVELRVEPGGVADLAALQTLVGQAEELCRRGLLLTLPVGRAGQRLLAWYAEEAGRQLDLHQQPRRCPVVDARRSTRARVGSRRPVTLPPPVDHGAASASADATGEASAFDVAGAVDDAARAVAAARSTAELLAAVRRISARLTGAPADVVLFSAPVAARQGTPVATPRVAGGLHIPVVDRRGHTVGSMTVQGRPGPAERAALVAVGHLAGAAADHLDLLDRIDTELTRLDLALEAGQLGTWTWELGDDTIRWSAVMERLHGLAPGQFAGTLEAAVRVVHPDDRSAALDQIRHRIAGRSRFELEHRIIRPDGTVRWMEAVGVPVLGADGEVLALTGVTGDVTERHELQHRLQTANRLATTLERVGRAVTAQLDIRDLMQVVVDEAVALIPAVSAAFVVDAAFEGSDGEAPEVGPAAADRALNVRPAADRATAAAGSPGSPSAGRRLTVVTPQTGAGAGFVVPRDLPLLQPTLAGGGTVIVDDVGAHPTYRPLLDGTVAAGLRSLLAVPVVDGDGMVTGGLFFGHPRPGAFSADDARLLEGIAGYAAIALQNGRLYEQARRELQRGRRRLAERDHLARTLQQSLLPPTMPDIPGLELASAYLASGRGNEVGGDFYDVFPLDRAEWAVVIGDVCGKGPEAAAITAAARHTIRAVARDHRQPAAVLRRVNEALVDYPLGERFCTVAFARLVRIVKGVRLSICCAGHLPPMVRRHDGSVEEVGSPGSLLGVFPEVRLWEQTVQLAAGDAIVFFTDGVTEARHGGRLFGTDGVRRVLHGTAGLDAPGVVGAVTAAVRTHSHGELRDDVAAVVVQVEP